MGLRRSLMAAAASAAVAVLGFSAASEAAFPNYSDCPRATVNSCINIQGQNGNINIKGFDVPLGPSLEIRGGVITGRNPVFVAPRGTNGFFARPVAVPGGLLGIDFPGPFDDVTATAELAGQPSDIHLNLGTFAISLPIRLHLEHFLLGDNCRIGPVQLNLQTTRQGALRPGNPGLIIDDNVSADSSFSIPGAEGCAWDWGLVNGAINLKLGLPSSSGNNSITTTNDIGLVAASAL